MNSRTLTESDLDQLLDIWNDSARFDPLTADLLWEKSWGDHDFDHSLAIGLELDDRLVAFACGVLRDANLRKAGYIKMLAVHPDFQGQGLGKQLAGQLEDRLTQLGASAVRLGESAPNYLVPGIDVRYTQAMLMFESLGYERIGETYNLAVDLTSQEFETDISRAKLESLGIQVRRAVADDTELIHQMLIEHWPTWVQEISVALKNDPPAVHLALHGSTVIGFAAYDGNNLGSGWFGPMGTHPQSRGKGIGAILLRRCLVDLRNQGHSAAIIPWVGPIKFYVRHAGAYISRVFYRFEKSLGNSVS